MELVHILADKHKLHKKRNEIFIWTSFPIRCGIECFGLEDSHHFSCFLFYHCLLGTSWLVVILVERASGWRCYRGGSMGNSDPISWNESWGQYFWKAEVMIRIEYWWAQILLKQKSYSFCLDGLIKCKTRNSHRWHLETIQKHDPQQLSKVKLRTWWSRMVAWALILQLSCHIWKSSQHLWIGSQH